MFCRKYEKNTLWQLFLKNNECREAFQVFDKYTAEMYLVKSATV